MGKLGKSIFSIVTIVLVVLFAIWSSVVKFEPKLEPQKSDDQIKSELLKPLTGGEPQAGRTPQVPDDVDKYSKNSESKSSSPRQSASVFDAMSSKNTQFNSLSSEQQLTLFISYAREVIGDTSEYDVYMGTPNYIVITDKNGLGGPFNQSFAIKDNHDGTFDFYGIDSKASSLAERNKNNSFWKKTQSASDVELVKQLDENTGKLNDIFSKIDLSKSSDSFSYLPIEK